MKLYSRYLTKGQNGRDKDVVHMHIMLYSSSQHHTKLCQKDLYSYVDPDTILHYTIRFNIFNFVNK